MEGKEGEGRQRKSEMVKVKEGSRLRMSEAGY